MTRKKVVIQFALLPCEKAVEKGGVPLKRGTTYHLFVNPGKNICLTTFTTF
jgi:hypothetical protein